MAAVDIQAVRKLYGRLEVLHGVDLKVPDGAFAVIVGPSGCGKSTLLRMIAGLEEISAGEIRIDSQRVNDLTPRQRGCAMVFQNYALYPHMSVGQNIAYPLKVAGMKGEERQRRVAETADLLGLGDLLDRRPGQLSGGQRQRVAMGRAIVRQPKVFLFDEPLSNLDAKLRVQMRIEIRRLHRRIGTTSIFVTHDQVEAMTMADLLIVMDRGNIEQIGPPADIYRRPASTFVAGFMGAPPMNLVEATITESGTLAVEGLDQLRIRPPASLGRPGQRIVMGIRPEDVAIADGELDGAKMAVDMVEELGAGRCAYGSFGKGEFAIALPEAVRLSGNGVLSIRLPADKLHFFDPSTRRRIEPSELAQAA